MDPESMMRVGRQALPPVEGDLAIPGLREPVEVLRDRWGVPHIYAGDLHDLFLAQGYVMASERLFQIELLWRLGSGRLSEVLGPGYTLGASKGARPNTSSSTKKSANRTATANTATRIQYRMASTGFRGWNLRRNPITPLPRRAGRHEGSARAPRTASPR
jgi:hypothetical protein